MGTLEVLLSMLLSIALNWMAKVLIALRAGLCASAGTDAQAGELLQWLFV